MKLTEQEMFVYLIMNGWVEETTRKGIRLENGRGGGVSYLTVEKAYHFQKFMEEMPAND